MPPGRRRADREQVEPHPLVASMRRQSPATQRGPDIGEGAAAIRCGSPIPEPTSA